MSASISRSDLDDLGSGRDAGAQVLLGWNPVQDAEALQSLDDDLHGAVLSAHDAQDPGHGADLVHLPGERLFDRRVLRGNQADQAVALHGVLHELHGPGNAHRQRDDGKGECDCITQGQNRELPGDAH